MTLTFNTHIPSHNFSYFPFAFEGWLWVLIASVPGLGIRFTLLLRMQNIYQNFEYKEFVCDRVAFSKTSYYFLQIFLIVHFAVYILLLVL